MDSRFSCNICFDSVQEPVVTQCGHLYCWPCLFRWLEPGMTLAERQSLDLPSMVVLESQHYDASRRFCPVCKAACCVSNLIPIYVKSTATARQPPSDVAAAAAAAAANESEKSRKPNRPQQQLPEATAAAAASPLQPVPLQPVSQPRQQQEQAPAPEQQQQQHGSRNNLSEFGNSKHSSNSTIATEQEDDDDEGGGDPQIGAPLLETESDQQDQEEELYQQQPVLSMNDADFAEDESLLGGSGDGGGDSTDRGEAPPASALGALQRQRQTSSSSGSSPAPPMPPPFPISATLTVPSRPSSQVRPRAFSENAVGILQQREQQQQENGNTHLSRTLAMSQGLAMTLHRALQPTGSTNSTAQAAAEAAAEAVVVPPLHRAEGFGNAAAMNTSAHLRGSDPAVFEFLSRILIMLASFVILCLLLF